MSVVWTWLAVTAKHVAHAGADAHTSGGMVTPCKSCPASQQQQGGSLSAVPGCPTCWACCELVLVSHGLALAAFVVTAAVSK